MKELTENQIETIEQILRQQTGSSLSFTAELVDHVCCATEAYMEQGLPFETALPLALQGFGNNGIKKTAQKVKRTEQLVKIKQQPLTWISPLLAICLLFVVVNVGAKDRPDRKPTDRDFRISSGFGYRLHPFTKEQKMHRGVDIVMPVGTAVVATADGVVESVENIADGYGIYVKLKHHDDYQTVYAQLSEVKVKPGESVVKGQVIALSGNSGMSTAPHLHYEVIHKQEWVDPAFYFGEELNPVRFWHFI